MNANSSEQSSASFQGFAPSGSTFCPDCRYDLIGLPAEHYCPECGLPYDRETYVFDSALPRWPLGVLIFIIAALLIFYVGLGVIEKFRPLPGLVFPLLGMLAFQIFLFRRMGRLYLALTPRGIIAFTTQGWRRKEFPWKELRPIDMDRKQRGLFLFMANIQNNRRMSIELKPFAKSRRDKLRLFELIEHLRQQRLESMVGNRE